MTAFVLVDAAMVRDCLGGLQEVNPATYLVPAWIIVHFVRRTGLMIDWHLSAFPFPWYVLYLAQKHSMGLHNIVKNRGLLKLK